MNSQTLREARRFEEATEKTLNQSERPAFHLAARIGWMNDPNGFSIYKGRYHMFYQYYPYQPVWGPMHWGHAVSKDLLHWEYLPTAMAPDSPYDRDGCFSGSALELPDGKQLLMYTGVLALPTANGGIQEIQTQCLAVGDGVDYVKYEKNPVITAEDFPADFSRNDFRDPKIWRKEDGTYRCIVANRHKEEEGQLLLFESQDAFSWKFKKIFAENHNRYGKMWECPDFFALDGKHVILTSPQDMFPKGFEYHNGNGTLCLIGSYDDETESFTEEADQAIDYGIDFYAPQTILTEDGRRVMIGWLQNWDTINHGKQNIKWFGQMSLPRELSIRNGRLYQWPIRELETLRHDRIEYQNVKIIDKVILSGVEGRRVDMEITVRPGNQEKIYRKFDVCFAENELYHSQVSFRPYDHIMRIDRKFSGSLRAIIHQRRCKVIDSDRGELKMRVVLDNTSVEVFINDGIQVMSATIHTDMNAQGISFYADGEVEMDIVKYTLD
ncbi:MAG: glycoside hydrolase family 32 protein [Blautia sp.]|nr:glycoside hydrolase family 32 protein [Blautia sp.]